MARVEFGPGRRGELSFRVGRREIGHLHGDRSAHFGFLVDVWQELHDAGRITHHPLFPGRPRAGRAAHRGRRRRARRRHRADGAERTSDSVSRPRAAVEG